MFAKFEFLTHIFNYENFKRDGGLAVPSASRREICKIFLKKSIKRHPTQENIITRCTVFRLRFTVICFFSIFSARFGPIKHGNQISRDVFTTCFSPIKRAIIQHARVCSSLGGKTQKSTAGHRPARADAIVFPNVSCTHTHKEPACESRFSKRRCGGVS